jgi:hypothetical protein
MRVTRADLRLYEFCGLNVASGIALPPLRRGVRPAQCIVTVEKDAAPLTGVSWFHQWRRPRGPRWLSFGRFGGGYVLRFAEDLADFIVSRDGTRVAVRPRARLPIDTLRHLLIDQVLPLVMSRGGRLSLHASAVHIAGVGTVGFVGEAGRGKSTLAAALAAAGASIVTDDCLALDVRDGDVWAIPGYPGLRLWPGGPGNRALRAAPRRAVAHYSTKLRVGRPAATFRAQRSPLRALFLLGPRTSKAPAVSVRGCRKSARFMGLLRYAYMLDVEDRDDLAAVFAGVSTVAETIPVMRLRVRSGARHLSAAAALIEEIARHA